MTIQEFIQLARDNNLMTIQKPYGLLAGDYTLVFEDAYGNKYDIPKLFKGNDEVII